MTSGSRPFSELRDGQLNRVVFQSAVAAIANIASVAITSAAAQPP